MPGLPRSSGALSDIVYRKLLADAASNTALHVSQAA